MSLATVDRGLNARPGVRDKTIARVQDAVARLKAEGVAVVTLVSDLPNSRPDHFIGTNSVAAGRTAGLMMERFARRPGEVLVVTNSMRARQPETAAWL